MAVLWLFLLAIGLCVSVLPLNAESNITLISAESEDDAMEYAPGMFEGDIDEPGYNPWLRLAISHRFKKWPNGLIPYRIHSSFPSGIAQMFRDVLAEMQRALRTGNRYCIRFVERTTESDYVYIQSLTGCHSKIGRSGGVQLLSMGFGCLYRGTMMHEMMHALGFWHEQSRADRDSFVRVNWDNIASEKTNNFAKHISDGSTLGLKYNLLSIMHYGPYTFAKSKSTPALTPIQRGLVMGQRRGLTPWNVKEIQLKYGCPVDTSHARPPLEPRHGSIFDCNFETDMCGLTNNGDFNWVRHAGPTPTAGTGPNADYTSGNGYYLYAEASNHKQQTARIVYPSVLNPGTYCIVFHYWLYGKSSMHRLKAGAEIYGRRQILHSLRYNSRNYWQTYKLTLKVSQPWKFFFEVTPTTSYGDIAIDNMEVFPDGCPRYENY